MDKERKFRYTKIELVIRAFQVLIQFTLYHSVACLIAGIGIRENGHLYLRMGILLLPLFIFLFVRMYIGNLFLFAFLHIGCVGGILLFFPSAIGERIAVSICLIVMVVNSIRFRITKSYQYQECPHLLMLSFLFIVYVFASYIEKTILMKQCFYELVAFLLFYMISKNLENTEKFIYLNRETANFPIQQIKGVNRTLLCFFTIVMLGGMLLAPRFYPEHMIQQIGALALIGLRWLFSLMQKEEVDQGTYLDIKESINQEDYGFLIEEEVPSKLALFLQYLMEIFTLIFLIAIVLAGVGFCLYQIYKRFYALPLPSKKEGKKTDIITVTESVPIFRKQKVIKEELGNYNKKIRRQYKKSVKRRKGKEQILELSLTPTEIENVLEQPLLDLKKRERIITLYEKARYGKEECIKEELEEVRKML